MTVPYANAVSTVTGLGNFWKLSFTRWRGSIVKLLWLDFAVFLGFFFAYRYLYFNGMPEGRQVYFENLVIYLATQLNNLELSFVLGFYSTYIYRRW